MQLTRKAKLESPPLDLFDEVVCVETFRPAAVAPEVEKGRRYPRDSDLVRAFPEYFALVIPVAELDGLELKREIERG